MLAPLRPLFPYLRRYSRDFVWGGFAAVIANAIWIFFPQILRIAVALLLLTPNPAQLQSENSILHWSQGRHRRCTRSWGRRWYCPRSL